MGWDNPIDPHGLLVPPGAGTCGDPQNVICTEGVTEISSKGLDPYWAAYGTSPWAGSQERGRILVPAAPNTPGPLGVQSRYVIRLAAHQVVPGFNARIHSLRTYVDIGLDAPTNQPGVTVPLFQPIVSPFWTFPDAIVSFHLTALRGAPSSVAVPGAMAPWDLPPGWSNQLDSTSTGIIAQNNVTGTGHLTLFPNDIPGTPLGSLGSFSDTRFPWISSAIGAVDMMVEGPCLIGLYAVVLQTNPQTRPVLPAPQDLGAWSQEQRFVNAYPDARIYSVAGAIMVEDVPSPSMRGVVR